MPILSVLIADFEAKSIATTRRRMTEVRERERKRVPEREKHIADVTQSYVCRGLWANGMQVSGGDGGSLPARRASGSIGISIFMGLSRLRATVPRGT